MSKYQQSLLQNSQQPKARTMMSNHLERRKSMEEPHTLESWYTWSEEDGNTLVLVPSDEGHENLKISIWDQGMISDTLVGQASLPLQNESLQEKCKVIADLDTGGKLELSIGWQHANPAYRETSDEGRKSMPSSVSFAGGNRPGTFAKTKSGLFNSVRIQTVIFGITLLRFCQPQLLFAFVPPPPPPHGVQNARTGIKEFLSREWDCRGRREEEDGGKGQCSRAWR